MCGMGIFVVEKFHPAHHYHPAGAFLVVSCQERAEFSARQESRIFRFVNLNSRGSRIIPKFVQYYHLHFLRYLL